MYKQLKFTIKKIFELQLEDSLELTSDLAVTVLSWRFLNIGQQLTLVNVNFYRSDKFKLDTTDLGELVKVNVRMDISKGAGLLGSVDDWYLLKVCIIVETSHLLGWV